MAKFLRTLMGLEVIRERWLAILITYSVAQACGMKGLLYLEQYHHSWFGWMLFALSPLTAVVVGVNLFALTRHRAAEPKSA